MKIFFDGDKKIISSHIKNIIPNIVLKFKKGVIYVDGFKKGFISNYIPRISAIDGVLRIDTDLDEIAPLSSTKNFHFKKPFNSNRKFIIAGPCVIDNFEIFKKTVIELKNLGVNIIRTPLFKPRSSPYAWEGFGVKGIKQLSLIKNKYKFISVMEILDYRLIEKIYDVCDIIQIGARNMRNYVLLKEVASTEKVALLKRHPYATLKELILSVEYLAKYGAKKIILCERGDSFSDGIPSMNINIIKEIKKSFNIPIIADISHSAKNIKKSFEFALKSFRYSDGLMVEVSSEPNNSPIDTRQVMSIEEFKNLLNTL